MAAAISDAGVHGAPGVYAPHRSHAGTKLSWPLNLLLLYIAGITIFGKGPTYIGFEPVFWGEVVLGLSLLWAFRRWHRVVIRTSQARALTLLILCFITVGAIETVVDYPEGRLNSLRDAAVWYYAFFYFVGLVIASNGEQFRIFTSRWKLFWLLAVPWGIAELLSGNWLSQHSPTLPGSRGVLLLSNSGSELAQNIGLGCLLLVSGNWRGGLLTRTSPRVLLALLGLAAVALYPGRGSKVSVIVAFLVFFAVSLSQSSSGRAHRRRLSVMVLVVAAAIASALAGGLDITSRLGLDRFSEVAPGQIEGTAEWRLEWWRGLYNAVMDRNPLFGLGFGDGLIGYNPYIVGNDSSPVLNARSPHNFNITIFARMGIVGSLLWGGILLVGLFIPLWSALTASTALERAESGYRAFWIAAIFAAWVDSSFGVLMEGPVMAIPFWLILGMLSMRPNLNSQIVAQRSVEHFRVTKNRHRQPQVNPAPHLTSNADPA